MRCFLPLTFFFPRTLFSAGAAQTSLRADHARTYQMFLHPNEMTHEEGLEETEDTRGLPGR
jgi:hypothetical protein